MFEVTRRTGFSAAHSLRGYKGKCEHLHGHNWVVLASVQSKELNSLGMVIDFHELDQYIKEILSPLDHKFINEVNPFDKINPSAENIAKFIGDKLKEKLHKINLDYKVSKCEVRESENSFATYYPD